VGGEDVERGDGRKEEGEEGKLSGKCMVGKEGDEGVGKEEGVRREIEGERESVKRYQCCFNASVDYLVIEGKTMPIPVFTMDGLTCTG
jgi:hypothetical protein